MFEILPDMPDLCGGNLRNSSGDIVIDVILLLAVICSYIPQIARVRNATSSYGLSTTYLTCHALFSTAQLASMILSAGRTWPSREHPIFTEINRGRLRGMKALGGVLGLLQILAQSACSIVLTITFAYSATDAVSRKTILTIILLYITVGLFPAALYTFPEAPARVAPDPVYAVLELLNIAVATFGVLIQFIAQFAELQRQHGDPGSLSLLLLCLQIPIMATLAARWYLRIKTENTKSLWEVYPDSIPVFTYATWALGSAALLAYSFIALRDCVGPVEESGSVPLLG